MKAEIKKIGLKVEEARDVGVTNFKELNNYKMAFDTDAA